MTETDPSRQGSTGHAPSSPHKDQCASHAPESQARINRILRMRSACSQALIRATSEAELLQTICRVAVEAGGYRMGWIGMLRHDPNKTIEIVAHAGQGDYRLDNLGLSWAPDSPQGQGPAGMAARSGTTIVVHDIHAHAAYATWSLRLKELGCHSVVCLPLHDAQSATFGLLYLFAPDALNLGPEETELLEAMAADLAFGLSALRSRAHQQHLQSILLKVATAVSASTGSRFFDQLVQHVADALGACLTCVARLLPEQPGEPRRVQALSYTLRGPLPQGLCPTTPYPLTHSPNAQLLEQRQFIVASDLVKRYPNAPVIPHLQHCQAYVGLQLTASDATPIGLIFAIFEQPLHDTQLVCSTLQIFAARAAAELERQLADSRIRQQASLLDKAGDAIIVRDMQQRVTFWSQGAERLYGWTRQEVLGKSIATLIYKDRREFDRAVAKVLQQGDWNGEILQFDRQGHGLEVEARWTMVYDEQGQPEAILAINTDIAKRKANEREIQRLAYFDTLTGLPNRARLMQRITQALDKAKRRHQGGALLFIDLDNFKTLNDTLGHDMGDQLLQLVAQRLNTCVRPSDTVARLGGDEFVILIEDLHAQSDTLAVQARSVGEKVLSMLSQPYALGGYQYRSTPSIGVAPFNGTPETVGELLKQADLAMYQAKAAGRGTLCFFDPQMQHRMSERMALETDLRNALAQDEFLLYYQPTVDSQGRIQGVEALLRWAHPQRGMVPPGQFIALAEETGLILPLGRWILHQACTQLASWQNDPALAQLTMAVNVSAQQFCDPGFVADVLRVLAITAAPAAQLRLELTESLLVHDIEAAVATMQALGMHGVGFVLDDFGTGYSSLAYLKRLPLQQLKIDQSFVRDVLDDANDATIVQTIVALASNLGLSTVAEGVETQAQLDWLLEAGCQGFQGFFIHRPMPADQLDRLLTNMRQG